MLAHDLTENCPGGSVRDWVVYEYPLPADSPWRQVSYAQIRCLRTPAPEQTGSPLTASALGSHRSPGTLERTESWVGNTPLLLRADRPELCRTILTHGAAEPVLRFFREVDCRRHILCFCRGKPLCLCPGQPPGSALEPPGRALSRGDPPEHRRCLPDSAADPAPGRLTPLPLTQCFLPPFPQCPVRLL